MGVVGLGDNWYSDPDPNWLGGHCLGHDAFSRQAQDAPSVVVLEADSPLSYVQRSAVSPGVVRLS